MNPRTGEVWYRQQRIGTLTEDPRGAMHFAYDGDWLAAGGFPVSISLPTSLEDRPTEATGYFEGLLPEGAVRQRVCRQLGIAADDAFGLLLAIGEDCAGALSIVPQCAARGGDEPPPETLDNAEILEMARSRGQRLPRPGRRQRFSLAGAQEKQPVVYRNGRYALPNRAHPSSHILKFDTISRVCLAEYLAMGTAGALELPVAAMEFLTLQEDVPLLRIRRFDRMHGADGILHRLHQEDLLQALGRPSIMKYQREGGPSLAQIADILRAHTDRPAIHLARLRDWQMFNCLIGNWDGHAKNLALLYPTDSAVPELAPFYDLVAIEFLNRLRPGTWSRDMAFAVGTQVEPERITRAEWQQFAKDLGMPPRPTLARLEELALRLPEVAAQISATITAEQFAEPTLQQFQDSVQRRCRWVLNSVLENKCAITRGL